MVPVQTRHTASALQGSSPFHLFQLEQNVQQYLVQCVPNLVGSSRNLPTTMGFALAKCLLVLAAVRVALAVYRDEVSPRFCYCPEALIVDWDGQRATPCGSVHLGTSPYPTRLERLADLSVTWLVCGAFPRERLHEASRCGIRVSCGAAGLVPTSPAALARFLARMNGASDA
jgi:hypothetical protein